MEQQAIKRLPFSLSQHFVIVAVGMQFNIWDKTGRANTNRSYLFFETLHFELLFQYHSFISDSR
jgi:hypothetical protein